MRRGREETAEDKQRNNVSRLDTFFSVLILGVV
jgi:hypothetical protein